MTELREDELMVHLTMDDARTAQAAGARFAHTLAGADPAHLELALDEQADLVQHAITDASYSTAQACRAAIRVVAALPHLGCSRALTRCLT